MGGSKSKVDDQQVEMSNKNGKGGEDGDPSKYGKFFPKGSLDASRQWSYMKL